MTTSERSEAERAAEATRRAILRIQKIKRRKVMPRMIGEIGHRDSMFFDHELDSTEPVIFDPSGTGWKKPGRWVER